VSNKRIKRIVDQKCEVGKDGVGKKYEVGKVQEEVCEFGKDKVGKKCEA
jgi:hypothetical protein